MPNIEIPECLTELTGHQIRNFLKLCKMFPNRLGKDLILVAKVCGDQNLHHFIAEDIYDRDGYEDRTLSKVLEDTCEIFESDYGTLSWRMY